VQSSSKRSWFGCCCKCAKATATLPPGTSASSSALANMTATPLVEGLWKLPVVENATYLATSGRPTTCPKGPDYGLQYDDIKRCSRIGSGRHREWDECSCGISQKDIPGPRCLDFYSPGLVKPSPYWGTGYNGCYCWCTECAWNCPSPPR